jgi:hypothetical protein
MGSAESLRPMPRAASPIPRTASTKSWKTSGSSGLPKFRQSVIATGTAPTAATFRTASATAAAPAV